ncbi:MAG TPA: hypothetical protein VFB80_08550 [Pirellulaceae bacterium]|nr:hypothetical protein [Pirellulaceae bacterium]
MSSLNPYAAPATLTPQGGERPATALGVVRAFLIVAIAAGACAIAGAILGSLIGWLLPDYYHAVFGNPTLNTVQVGIGLGLTQGLGAGFVVGVMVVLAVAISIRRRA